MRVVFIAFLWSVALLADGVVPPSADAGFTGAEAAGLSQEGAKNAKAEQEKLTEEGDKEKNATEKAYDYAKAKLQEFQKYWNEKVEAQNAGRTNQLKESDAPTPKPASDSGQPSVEQTTVDHLNRRIPGETRSTVDDNLSQTGYEGRIETGSDGGIDPASHSPTLATPVKDLKNPLEIVATNPTDIETPAVLGPEVPKAQVSSVNEAVQAIQEHYKKTGQPVDVVFNGHGEPGKYKIGNPQIDDPENFTTLEAGASADMFKATTQGQVNSCTFFSCSTGAELLVPSEGAPTNANSYLGTSLGANQVNYYTAPINNAVKPGAPLTFSDWQIQQIELYKK